MNRLLSANLQVWHLLVGVVAVVALGVGGVVMARPVAPQPVVESTGGVTPAAFFPPGTVRMTASLSHDAVYVKATDGLVSVLSTTFTVPGGQRADVASFFSGEAYKYPNGYCYLEFHLDSLSAAPLNPGEVWVADGYVHKGGYPTLSAQGLKANIPAGNHRIHVGIRASGGDCYLKDRSLIVFANLHA